jgi:hypothetical protein
MYLNIMRVMSRYLIYEACSMSVCLCVCGYRCFNSQPIRTTFGIELQKTTTDVNYFGSNSDGNIFFCLVNPCIEGKFLDRIKPHLTSSLRIPLRRALMRDQCFDTTSDVLTDRIRFWSNMSLNIRLYTICFVLAFLRWKSNMEHIPNLTFCISVT